MNSLQPVYACAARSDAALSRLSSAIETADTAIPADPTLRIKFLRAFFGRFREGAEPPEVEPPMEADPEVVAARMRKAMERVDFLRTELQLITGHDVTERIE